jgi:hypothetical protein
MMIQIAIGQAAFDAIAATTPLGSVNYEAQFGKGERAPSKGSPPARQGRELERRDPVAGGFRTRVTKWVLTRKPRLCFYSSLGECVTLDLARLG